MFFFQRISEQTGRPKPKMVFVHRDLDKEKKKEANDPNKSTDSGNLADISSTSIEVEIESEVDGKKVTSRVIGTVTPIIGSAVIEQETTVSCDFYFHFFFRIYLLPKDRNIDWAVDSPHVGHFAPL